MNSKKPVSQTNQPKSAPDLLNIPDLEDEQLIAQGLADTMWILYTGISNGKSTGITYEEISESLWLLFNIMQEHAKKLKAIVDAKLL